MVGRARTELEDLRTGEVAELRDEVRRLRAELADERVRAEQQIAAWQQDGERRQTTAVRRLGDAARAEERASGARVRAELGALMIEARAELITLQNELERVGGDIRTAASQAEDRVSQTGRIAESMVLTRAQAATAEAVRELTATATEISRLIAQEASVAEAHERLESVLVRLRATDQRLRASDERTRRTLGHLRAVPDGHDVPPDG